MLIMFGALPGISGRTGFTCITNHYQIYMYKETYDGKICMNFYRNITKIYPFTTSPSNDNTVTFLCRTRIMFLSSVIQKRIMCVAPGGGGGGTDSLSLCTNCETTAPPF